MGERGWIPIAVLVLVAVAVALLIFICIGCGNAATQTAPEVVVETDDGDQKKEVRVETGDNGTTITVSDAVTPK